MRYMMTLAMAALLLGVLPGMSSAQINEKFADMSPYVDEAREVMRTDRKVLIRRAMRLTAEEEQKFWTPYRKYSEDMEEVRDLRIKVITDFAANIDNMTDDLARQILKDWLEYSDRTVKVRRKHLNGFRKAVGYQKVVRFYQLENKVDTIINFAIAMQVPLLEVN